MQPSYICRDRDFRCDRKHEPCTIDRRNQYLQEDRMGCDWLRFFQTVWWTIKFDFEKYFKLYCVLLFQWNLICTFNQHCLSYAISIRLQFNSSVFFWKLFETVLHRQNFFFQNVLHIQKTFKYIHTDTYILYGP